MRGLAAVLLAAALVGGCGEGDAPTRERTLTATLEGEGRIDSDPAGLACTGSCSATFAEGTRVRLTATPDAGYDVGSWTGCDAPSGPTCTVTLEADREVGVRFVPTLEAPEVGTPLELRIDGAGAGLIESDPAGLACREDCRATFPASREVTLRGYPDAGSVFGTWSGCDRTRGATCTVTLTSLRSVTATFEIAPVETYALRVTRTGSGEGRVTADAVALDCGEACDANVPDGTTVTLTAEPAPGSRPSGWEGCDSVDGPRCTVAPTGDQDVVARFEVERASAKIRADGATCSGTAAGEACRTAVVLADAGASWAGVAFDATSDAFDVRGLEASPELEACLVSAGATRVALVCPTPVDLATTPLGLELHRTATEATTLTLDRAEGLPYDGGRYPVGGARVDIGRTP